MKEIISQHTEELKKRYADFFLPHFTRQIEGHIKFIRNFCEVLENYKNEYRSQPSPDFEFINNLKLSYHKRTFDLLQNQYGKVYKQNFDNDLAQFIIEINSYMESVDKNLRRIQEEERFVVKKEDSFRVKFYKRLKIIFYNIYRLPLRTGNVFRKLFGKPVRKEVRWFHNIPLRNLTVLYLRDEMCLNLLPHIEEINKRVSSVFLELWKADEEFNMLTESNVSEFEINIENKIEELDRIPDELADSVERVFIRTSNLYEEAISKAGTIELPSGKLSSKIIDKKHDELNKEYESLYSGWSNTFFALFDDWKLNKELYIFGEKLNNDFHKVSVLTEEKIYKNIIPNFEGIRNFLYEVVNRLNEFSGSSSEAKAALFRERDRIYNKLSENAIPETSDIILEQNIPDVVDWLEYNITKNIKNLSEKRAIVKTSVYTERIKVSEIDYISPNEIITYSSLPSYIKASTGIKSNITQHLNEIQKGLKDIEQIADFNLESALSMFGSEKSAFEDPVDIAVEGINRAITKEEILEKKLKDIEVKINSELRNSVQKINNQIIELTKNENIFEIRLKIARTKTLQRTEELKHKTLHSIKNFFPILLKGIKDIFIYSTKYYTDLRRKFGLAPPHVSISTEISDFLAATENAVSKLPFVYQRLFSIEPLEDERFFEGRNKELTLLNAAYENWVLKKYAPAAIVGEKGSGITTLLNFYFRQIDTSYEIIRTRIDNVIYYEKEFIDFLKKTLKNNSFNNIEEIVKYLNGLVTRQVIVIENIQNLFLKKVNGFNCLKMFFELISKTNQNVFWIVTSTLYAWEYLSKTMNVPDYFGYNIRLEQLTGDQMIDIILKRHRISGYNIYFEEPGETLSRKHKKLSGEEMQVQLKKEYFTELNRFAKSNISLALLYWMRSTKEVTKDTIKIGSVIELDFSFLEVMNPDKFFILYILLLHDGLTEENIVEVYNKLRKEIRLSLLILLDDGVIIKRGDLFIINPLLYRQIVYVLQSKNIIH